MSAIRRPGFPATRTSVIQLGGQADRLEESNQMRTPLLSTLLIAVVATSALADQIVSVDRTDGSDAPARSGSPFEIEFDDRYLADADWDPFLGHLAKGEFVYTDRDLLWDEIPTEFLPTSQTVQTFNNDADIGTDDVRYHVQISGPTKLALIVDNRIETDFGQPLQQAVDNVVRDFAKPGQFQDTNLDVVSSEPLAYSVFTADLDAGTYAFAEAPNDQAFYSIATIVPEPTSLMLLSVLLLGLGGKVMLRRRRAVEK